MQQITYLNNGRFSSMPMGMMSQLPNFDTHTLERAVPLSYQLHGAPVPTAEQVMQTIEEYRMFLHRHKLAGMPEQFEVPSAAVDIVWHVHMTETRQYEADMMAYFGQPFHHASRMCSGGADD